MEHIDGLTKPSIFDIGVIDALRHSEPSVERSLEIIGWNLTSVLVLLTSLVVAVDRSKFKSCSQSGFCKRCRAVEAGVSTYQV